MHETLNKFYKGNIDSIKKINKHYEVRGWVVPRVAADKCFIGCDGFVSVHPEERPDIFLLYKQVDINYLRCGFKLILNPSVENVTIFVNNEAVFKIEVEKFEHILTPNSNSFSTIIIDNFYEDPVAVREYVLKQEFVDRLKQKRTVKNFIPHWIQEKFESILNCKISFTEDSGIIYANTSKEIIPHERIKSEFAATIFLNNPNNPKVGIGFYEEDFSFNYKDIYDKTCYNLLDKINSKFNRLVIYNNKFIVAPLAYCGNNLQTSRLVQNFNFNIL